MKPNRLSGAFLATEKNHGQSQVYLELDFFSYFFIFFEERLASGGEIVGQT